ncbi:FecCD family ABC transporter permease [Microbacterium terricola]|uniref:ABC transporter permease n=1 Tax=Microbacterium terricola TaxID=344163 RepID=A0ABM8DZB3_9MICO|nr:iron chelate uptake ABC transporter family permease subunit [Microbacterium terricola]UYK41366.1 iron chelate uptake ABC transporter family permease subunit [Microbacterium terricola]BDV30850.1 ABC transporter permease [Microbacterium terricola]
MTATDTARPTTPAPARLDGTRARIADGRARRTRRRLLVTVVLFVAVVALFITMVSVGKTLYSLDEIWRVILGEKVPGASFTVGTLRLPRAVTGVLAGMAFGLAGSTFQTMLRNPLASPDIIGITAGASAAAVFAILVLGWSGLGVTVLALVVGLATALTIYLLARSPDSVGGRFILIGIGMGALLDGVVSYLLLKASAWDIPVAMRWLTGSLNGSRWQDLLPLLCAVVVLLPVLVVLGRNLRMLELGDAAASSLGVRVDATRVALILCAVALAAFATATTGPIAFVAFLAGPIAARLVGPGSATAVPAALTGAALVLAADLIGQFAFDTSFPVGVITGILGAPFLIALLIRTNRNGGFS